MTYTVREKLEKREFDNLSKAAIVGSAVEDVAPRIMYPTRIGDYRVSLNAPGDSISYSFELPIVLSDSLPVCSII